MNVSHVVMGTREVISPRKKTSLGESRPPGVRRILRSETFGESLSETFGKTVNETFRTKKSRQESRIGYAWLPTRLSPRLVFLRGSLMRIARAPILYTSFLV